MASPLLLAVTVVAVFFSVVSSEALTANGLFSGNDIPANSFPDTDGNAAAAAAGILLPSDKQESEADTLTDWLSDPSITTGITDVDLLDSVNEADPLPEPVTIDHFHPMRPPRPWKFPFGFRHPHPHRRHGPFKPTPTQFADPHREDVPYGNDMIFYGDGSLPEDSFRGGHGHGHGHGPRIPGPWMRGGHEKPSFWFEAHGHPHRHHRRHPRHHTHDGFAFDREMEGTRDNGREDGGGIMDGIRKFLNHF